MGRKISTVKATRSKKRKYWGKITKGAKEDPKKKCFAGSSKTTVEKRLDMSRDMNFFEDVADQDRFLLVSFEFMNKLFKKLGRCANCDEELKWNVKNRKGFAHEFVVSCSHCDDTIFKEYTSEQVTTVAPSGENHHHYSINTRIVFAAQQNSIHLRKLNSFSAIAGIEGSLAQTAYAKILKLVFEMNTEAIREHLVQSRQRVKKELGLKGEISDVMVSFDGTWQKRGYRSLVGAAFCIEAVTGVILDYHVCSSYCRSCTMSKQKLGVEFEEWRKEHVALGALQKNYDGTSGMMEPHATTVLW